MHKVKSSEATRAKALAPAVDLEDFIPTALEPSPIGHLPRKQKLKRIMGLLELSACHGDTQAARELLHFYRWEEEMKKGKPVARTDAPATAEPVRVV
ncbi:MAG: hypothetical protein GY722_07090, partial [bacterium]|nr:hypothetical protein [bacterium]